MPAITIQIDPLSEEKKQQLVKEITRVAAEITAYPPEFFFVYIDEYAPENIGVGGETLQEMRKQ